MREQPRVWDPRGVRRATVVAAHPDDETLGAAGLVQRLHADGVRVSLVIATDGEAAFPGSTPREREDLAARRRGELMDALAALGAGDVRPVWLGLPDSGLSERGDLLAAELAPHLQDSDLCVAPWPGDPHPDHRETGLAALRAAPEGAQCWSYPIWMWSRLDVDDPGIPWHRAFSLPLERAERSAKAAAIATFVSQTGAGPHGEEPILPADVLADFDRADEIFFREPPQRSASTRRFAALYQDSDDPWRARTRWYERRKRAAALAALPLEHYHTVVEPACGNGSLTRELAGRCDRLIAFDPVPAAVEAARQATSSLSHVDIEVGSVPDGLSRLDADLLVYSEILYYLSDECLTETLARSASALRPGGHLLAVHWKPWAPEAPRDGWNAHARLLDHPDFDTLVAHDDEEFVLHVAKRR